MIIEICHSFETCKTSTTGKELKGVTRIEGKGWGKEGHLRQKSTLTDTSSGYREVLVDESAMSLLRWL